MRARPYALCLVLAGCGAGAAPSDASLDAVADRASPADASPADSPSAMDAPRALDESPPADASPADDAPSSDAAVVPADGATGLDVVARPDAPREAAADVTSPADVVSTPDAAPADGGLMAPTCEAVRLTYYDVETAGACEVMDAPTALSDSARAGLTLAIAQAWSGGMAGGDPMAACGECWEVTTADAQRVLTVTDLCPVEGNPVCAGSFFHFDVNRTAATQLGYIEEGIVEARARRVPCPVTGSIRAVVRDQNPTFLRLALANMRVAVRAVSFRGAGPGVSAANPWTPMRRDGGAWAVTGVGTLTRGGTGTSLRIESAQGQVVESAAVIAPTLRARAVVDLGVQLDDRAPQQTACAWRPPSGVYVDDFGGIERVRWSLNAWAAATMVNASYATNCVGGTCLRVANVARYSGFSLFYPQSFSRSLFTRLSFRARSNAARRVSVVLADGTQRCTETAAMVTTAWQRFEVDLSGACGALRTLRTVEMRNDGADGAEIVLDDVRFEE